MKTVNCCYTSIDALICFLDQHKIYDNDSLLIQAFIGFSEAQLIKQFQAELATIFSKATLVGVTSDGNIIEGEIPELGQTTLSFSQFKCTTLTSALVVNTGDDFKVGQLLGSRIKQEKNQVVIAFSSGLKTSGESFLNGLSKTISNIPIAGGVAGHSGTSQYTFVFNLTEITSCGGVAVALNGEGLNVHTYYNFGWQPIGKKMILTHVDKNIVYEIDHQPIQNIYEKYFQSSTNLAYSKLEPDFSLFEFPLIKFEHGVYIARAALSRLKGGGLIFAGNLNQGDMVQFGISNQEKIIQDAAYALNQLKNIPVESIFIYSCTARRRLLDPNIMHDIESFKGVSSVSGFYTYGEFFYAQECQKSYFLNHAMTVLALSESPNKRITLNSINLAPKENHQSNYINSLIAVSNFAVNVSNDFESLNTKLESEVKRKSQALLRKTLIDDLTGLPGRLALLRTLQGCRNNILIVININDFSKINGFYGLDAGDELLSKIATNLQTHLRLNKSYLNQSKLYKLPSDEYAILTKKVDLKTLDTGMRVLNKQVFSHPYQILGFDILVQATWVFSPCDGTEKTLIQTKLITKKARLKKKNFVYYAVEDFRDSQYKIQLAHKVRRAILQNRLYPVFQPIYDNQTGALIKYECLARIKDIDGTVISPLVFIQVAQMIQMYPIVTEIMIHKSFRTFQESELCFSINLSLEDMLSVSTQNMIFEAIQYYDVASQVTFEILENQALENEPEITQFINRIKALGAKIAIDDFGSGYANFQHMAKLQADYIKIDGALIKTIGENSIALSVVESIIVFAKKLDIKVIAEFVCSQEIYELVKKEGVDYSQGFYLSEPLDQILSLSK